ncbi:S8 family serine peptidase [Rubritalea tangerina]|uniref:S8 family serine peptidase n=1 Tax=Rubritalea tangerina TaxID=430798 RepID=A0ABW4Z6V1_9BACT
MKPYCYLLIAGTCLLLSPYGVKPQDQSLSLNSPLATAAPSSVSITNETNSSKQAPDPPHTRTSSHDTNTLPPQSALPRIHKTTLANPQVRQQVVRSLQNWHTQQVAHIPNHPNLPRSGTTNEGMEYQLMGMHEGAPLYRSTKNVNASITVNATNARNTYQLNGAGVSSAIWDSNAARTSHNEFSGRVTTNDSATTLSYHHTHVSGTILGNGSNSLALGLAPAATLLSHDWNNDLAEIASIAAASPNDNDKITTSNHSYGPIAGWVYANFTGYTGWHWVSSSNSEHTLFGQYNQNVWNLDNICSAAPYYTSFWAAGNDRTDGPQNGEICFIWLGGNQWSVANYSNAVHPPRERDLQYDTIAGEAVAKNVITVGATYDGVSNATRSVNQANISTFSSWGPTDDGRIKPDIVANGVSLTSADSGSNGSYRSLSGTSMASPSAMGAALLIQQHYSNLFPNQRMRASSLKGLLIHTADDLGNPGPDYQYGWGLVNTVKALQILDTQANNPNFHSLTENTLSNESPEFTRDFHWDGTSQTLRITLCWTDPVPPTPISGLDNPQLSLVNDLDIRLITPSGDTIYPWILNPSSPSTPATNGDNYRDNVEQIILSLPVKGLYQLQITHKGSLLGGQQHFSLIMQGHRPSAFARWNMNESNNSIVDDSGNGRNAQTTPSGTAFTQGRQGPGLFLNGITGAMLLPPLDLDSDTFSLCAWIKPTLPNDSKSILFHGLSSTGECEIFLNNQQQLGYTWTSNNQTTTSQSQLSPPTNTWSFIALNITPTQATLTLNDGNTWSSHSNTSTHPAQSFDQVSYIGSSSTANHHLAATIDTVQLFNYSLSSNQITHSYLNSLPPSALFASQLGLSGQDIEPDSDVDNDGTSNLLEWALGSDITSPNRTISFTKVSNSLTLEYSDAMREGVTLTPQWSDNLLDWYSTGFIISEDGASIESSDPHLFIRLHVQVE